MLAGIQAFAHNRQPVIISHCKLEGTTSARLIGIKQCKWVEASCPHGQSIHNQDLYPMLHDLLRARQYLRRPRAGEREIRAFR